MHHPTPSQQNPRTADPARNRVNRCVLPHYECEMDKRNRAPVDAANSSGGTGGSEVGEERAETREQGRPLTGALAIFPENAPSEETIEILLRHLVALGGGRYMGVQKYGREPLVLFTSPRGSSLAVSLSILASKGAEAVRQHIQKSEDTFE